MRVQGSRVARSSPLYRRTKVESENGRYEFFEGSFKRYRRASASQGRLEEVTLSREVEENTAFPDQREHSLDFSSLP